MILVTNDDGVLSPGIQLLAKRLRDLDRVVIVAPDRERSAAGHSMTLHRPLLIEQIKEEVYSVNGTPTDCVNIAVKGLLKETPRLVVSGINKGPNLGDDITYSGTVAGAMEAILLGVPAIAFSLNARQDFLFAEAAEVALGIARSVLEQGLPAGTLLNVNVPNCSVEEIRGTLITRLGKRIYHQMTVERVDPRGKKYYWIGGGEPDWEREEGTDFDAVDRRHVSITPLHLDLTDHASFERLRPLEKVRYPGVTHRSDG
ncbi:MAG: 5'/3'-nucleotidase SurE [Nitrospirae bacterium GWC2_57_9]|nr:MAG: 5'/3'-nucleotidase SurE [Nitrospirae bacterium GWC2_57_9]